ncbi:hypothetical protein SAMN05216570_0071 [Dyella sp. OK004]|nr:hypothetical protein SAMN05216570_0071 [Dyella sp. OK004]
MRIDNLARRRLMQWSLAAVPALMLLDNAHAGMPGTRMKPATSGSGPAHDFDFFLGNWRVHHRRLRQWLVGSNDWEEFEGTSRCWSLLGGIVNLNESIATRADGTTSGGMGLRAYDAKTDRWADWYLSSRDPLHIDTPGIGGFAHGVGSFFSDDTNDGRPVKLRGMFSPIDANTCQWEQALSPDGGKTWETNWVMRYTRTA